jgi:hypothetical protein
LDFDISEHRDHHLKTELHKISFKNFPTDCASVAAPKFRIRFYENFQFFVEASVAIASAATVQLGFWFWHDLEIKAELRAWYYHKPQSPFLVIFPRHLSWTAQTRHTKPWGVLADCSIKTGACLAFDGTNLNKS